MLKRAFSPVFVGLVVMLGACSTGCTGPNAIVPVACDRPESSQPTEYNGGTVEHDEYMSAAWDGEWVHFPGGGYIRFHHQLGAVPRFWIPYLSFDRYGLANGGSCSIGAGDQVELEAIDDESLVMLNGTCTEYFLMVVAGL